MAKNTTSIVASGQAPVGTKGQILSITVNSHSSGVIKLIDAPNSPAGRSMFGGINGYTLPAGSSVIYLADKGVEYYEGVHVVIVSGTADIQLNFEPTS